MSDSKSNKNQNALVPNLSNQLIKVGKSLAVTKKLITEIENNPELMLINNEIVRNEGYIKSLKED